MSAPTSPAPPTPGGSSEVPPPLALVTGTSLGLGAAIARCLRDAGWAVHGFARGPAPDLASPPKTGPDGGPPRGSYHHHRLDLADPEAVERCFERELARSLQTATAPRVGLVNNAAVLDIEPTDQARLTHLVRSYVVNSVVPTWLQGWCLRHTPATTPLRIVNLSSGAATRPYPGWSAYCGSKAALAMAGEVLAVELEERPQLQGRDVAIVSYAPGVVATGMQAAIRAADIERFPRRARFEQLHEDGELVPAGKPAREIARLLASNDLPRISAERYTPPQG